MIRAYKSEGFLLFSLDLRGVKTLCKRLNKIKNPSVQMGVVGFWGVAGFMLVQATFAGILPLNEVAEWKVLAVALLSAIISLVGFIGADVFDSNRSTS